MPVAEILREVIVKVPGEHAKKGESDLSPLDALAPPIMIDLWFFYDYYLDDSAVEKALTATLCRYQELAGRLHPKKVILNNEGAKLAVLKESSLTLAEIENDNYNFAQLVQNFGGGAPFESEFLLTLSLQKLACDGMLLMISFKHLICDVNSFYLFVADFSSQLRDSVFKFHPEQVITEQRLLTLKPSGNPAIFEHPEYAVITEEMKIALFQAYFASQKKVVKLKLSPRNKQKLKFFVSGKAETDVALSANDCLLTALWTAFIGSAKIEEDAEKVVSTLTFQCNGRFRKQPPIPTSFFGNVVLPLPVKSSVADLSVNNMAANGEKIRKKILSVNNDFIQSTIDCLAANENLKVNVPQKYDLTVTNWDRPFEWYGESDLGHGAPKKFTYVTQVLDKTCIVLPDQDGGIEIIFGLDCEHMDRFLEHPLIAEYFTCFQ